MSFILHLDSWNSGYYFSYYWSLYPCAPFIWTMNFRECLQRLKKLKLVEWVHLLSFAQEIEEEKMVKDPIKDTKRVSKMGKWQHQKKEIIKKKKMQKASLLLSLSRGRDHCELELSLVDVRKKFIALEKKNIFLKWKNNFKCRSKAIRGSLSMRWLRWRHKMFFFLRIVWSSSIIQIGGTNNPPFSTLQAVLQSSKWTHTVKNPNSIAQFFFYLWSTLNLLHFGSWFRLESLKVE